MEIWINLIGPALTLIILIAGIAFSKVKLEQALLYKDKEHDTRLEAIEQQIGNPDKCRNCPEIMKLEKEYGIMNVKVSSFMDAMTEYQKDTKELVKQMAKMNQCLSALETKIEKILNGK